MNLNMIYRKISCHFGQIDKLMQLEANDPLPFGVPRLFVFSEHLV